MPADQAYSRVVQIHFPDGMHLRPATLIAQEARKYQAEVFATYRDRRASARNVFDMLTLGVEKGEQLTLEAADGEDARDAVDALAKLFSPEQAELFINGDDPA
jgi:phosphotransferase system HPr (HPr) family protein